MTTAATADVESAGRGTDVRELTDVVARLRRALRRSIRTDQEFGSRPMAQIEVLQTVRDTGTVRLRELADSLNLAQSTVSTLVGRLLTDGLLGRGTDPSDRRAAAIELSPAGIRQLDEWDRANRQRLEQALAQLSERDRRRIAGSVPALARLVAALERGTA